VMEAVIFDLDGLLLDTERPFLSLLRERAKIAGWDIPWELLVKTIGIDEKNSAKFWADNLGAAFPYKKLREEVYLFQYERVKMAGIAQKEGAENLIRHLRAKNYPVALATGTNRERTLWKLEAGRLAGLFDVIVTGSDVENGKPAPDCFLMAAEKLGVNSGCCTGFEDSPAGLLALRQAGIRSVFIKDLVEPESELLSSVWKVLKNLNEALPLFP